MCNITYCNEKEYTDDGYCIFHSYKSNNEIYVVKHFQKKIKIFNDYIDEIDRIIVFINMMQYIYYKSDILLKRQKTRTIFINKINYFYNYVKYNYNINMPIVKKFNIYYKKLCLILDIKNI